MFGSSGRRPAAAFQAPRTGLRFGPPRRNDRAFASGLLNPSARTGRIAAIRAPNFGGRRRADPYRNVSTHSAGRPEKSADRSIKRFRPRWRSAERFRNGIHSLPTHPIDRTAASIVPVRHGKESGRFLRRGLASTPEWENPPVDAAKQGDSALRPRCLPRKHAVRWNLGRRDFRIASAAAPCPRAAAPVVSEPAEAFSAKRRRSIKTLRGGWRGRR